MKAATNELRVFTRVLISAEGIPTVIGRIEDIRQPAELPDLDEMRAALPRSILEEWGVSRVAMISYYQFPGSQVMFCALEIGGSWFDLKRRELSLEVVGQWVAGNSSGP